MLIEVGDDLLLSVIQNGLIFREAFCDDPAVDQVTILEVVVYQQGLDEAV